MSPSGYHLNRSMQHIGGKKKNRREAGFSITVLNLLHDLPPPDPSHTRKAHGRYPTPKQALNRGVSFAVPATTDMLLTLLIQQYKQR